MNLLEKQLVNGLIYHPFDLTQSDIASLKVSFRCFYDHIDVFS